MLVSFACHESSDERASQGDPRDCRGHRGRPGLGRRRLSRRARSHRTAEPRAERLQPDFRRPGARARGQHRSAPCIRHAARSVGRCSDCREGQHVRARHAHHGLVTHPRYVRSSLRRDDHHEARRGGRGDRRQDELRRVRDGIVERELGVRTRPQPVGARSHARRIERRLRRRSRGVRAYRSRSAPILVVRSGSRHRSAVSPA